MTFNHSTEVQEEFVTFTQFEKEIFREHLTLLIESGLVPLQAERDAAAAILQHRRMHAPPTFTPAEIKLIERNIARNMQTGLSAELAEQSAWHGQLEAKGNKKK
jgi:hypothetical protein